MEPARDPHPTARELPLTHASFQQLTEQYAETVCALPPFQLNLMHSVMERHPHVSARLLEDANRARPILHAKVRALVKDFLWVKLRHGTPEQKAVYAGLFDSKGVATDRVEKALYQRLLTKRPVCCWLGLESNLLQGTSTEGWGIADHRHVGTCREKYPLKMDRVLSYEEMQIAAFLGLASGTHFVNSGSHFEAAYVAQPGTHQPAGVLIGVCLPRADRPGCHDWPHVVVTPAQNTLANGYGRAALACPRPSPAQRLLNVWAKFYRVGDVDRSRFHFPSWEEAKACTVEGTYLPLPSSEGFINVPVLQQRLRLVLEPFFLEANERAKAARSKAFVHVSPFDLTHHGEALLEPETQGRLFAEACMALLQSLALPHVADIYFAGFQGLAPPPQVPSPAGHAIRLHTGERSLADPVPDPAALLVGLYPLPSNALVGNEYWLGLYSMSATALAAACSTIPQVHNPLINPKICGANVRVYGSPPPKYKRGEISARFGPYVPDRYSCLEELQEDLSRYGVEACNLIIGVDFTASNLEQGQRTFGGKSLHHIDPEGGLNPYQEVMSVMCRTLGRFSEDGRVPAFGFGDQETKDDDVFSFWPDERPCEGLEEVLAGYNVNVPTRIPSGPTNFAPLINKAIDIVTRTKKYHILVIVADGKVTEDDETITAIQRASNHALSIVCIGVGDGPWELMEEFDDKIRDRWFYNFHFVDYSRVVSEATNLATSFAHAALQEIPQQYQAIKDLDLLRADDPDGPLKAYEASAEYGLISRTFKRAFRSPDRPKRPLRLRGSRWVQPRGA
uniref:VWFA domain-containing protein n=1 Tax=Eutreptiella gymnastica TaxID=73025 RepID=A0A6U8P674_9EUGL|mmetsp:Transcript_97320/g.167758  ORF Transcript_97320/g.167758 Transcript_97320/m.167758 type:complete len:792 (+) Transcript_97320:44-2419(+)